MATRRAPSRSWRAPAPGRCRRGRCPTWRRSWRRRRRGSGRWRPGSARRRRPGSSAWRGTVGHVWLRGNASNAQRATSTRATSRQDQPDGVPPLELTGERTLPDVPEENYWYRRHLAVYEWIAERCAGPARRRPRLRRGLRGRRAGAAGRPRSSGSTPTPRPSSTPGCATGGPTCASSAAWSRSFAGPATRSCSCRRSSTSRSPAPSASASRPWRPSPTSPPPTDSPWPAPTPRSPTTPGTCASTRSPSTARCSSRTSRASRCSASSTRARRAPTSSPCAPGGTASIRALRITKPFYDRYVPAISAKDFALREGDLDRALDFVAVCHA